MIGQARFFLNAVIRRSRSEGRASRYNREGHRALPPSNWLCSVSGSVASCYPVLLPGGGGQYLSVSGSAGLPLSQRRGQDDAHYHAISNRRQPLARDRSQGWAKAAPAGYSALDHRCCQQPVGDTRGLDSNLRRSPLQNPLATQLNCLVELERFQVWLDRITLCFPGRQSTLQEFDSVEMQSEGPTNNYSSGFIAGTGTVSNRILLSWNERRIFNYFSWGNPLCARDDLRIGQQIERLANIKDKCPLIRRQQRV